MEDTQPAWHPLPRALAYLRARGFVILEGERPGTWWVSHGGGKPYPAAYSELIEFAHWLGFL